MALHNFICDCGHRHFDVSLDGDQFDDHVELCSACGDKMHWSPGSGRKYKPFPAFVAKHLAKLNGGVAPEFHSLHEVREFEKRHADRNLTFEVFSFDNEHYGEE